MSARGAAGGGDRDDESEVEKSVVKGRAIAFETLSERDIKSLAELRTTEGWASLHRLLHIERTRIARLLRSPKLNLESIRFVQGLLAGTDDIATLVEVDIPEWYNRRGQPKGTA